MGQAGVKLTAGRVGAEVEVGTAELLLAALPRGLVHLLAALEGGPDLVGVADVALVLDGADDGASNAGGGADAGGRRAEADVQGDGDGDDDGGRGELDQSGEHGGGDGGLGEELHFGGGWFGLVLWEEDNLL